MKKTVLVTGGAGYIGSHVVLCCLLSRKYRVITIDNFHNSSPRAIDAVSKIALNALPADASDAEKEDTKVHVAKADLSNRQSIRNIFESYKAQGNGGIWGVIHIAAHKAVGESGEKPLQYYDNNVIATINLLNVMAEYGTNHLVYSSSATVYGAPTTIPIPESTPLDPQSCYGRTKAMTESIINDLCDADKNWRAISLRYFNPGGAHPSGELGESPLGRPGNLLPLLASIAVGNYPNDLKVMGNDYPTRDGCCIRDYIHIMDLAQGHLIALEGLEKDETFTKAKPTDTKESFGGSGGKYRAFNLGTGKGSSVLEIVAAMKLATGFDFKTEVVGRRIGDVPDLTADPKLAEEVLGFKATQTLETMCKDLWNWQTKNPRGFE